MARVSQAPVAAGAGRGCRGSRCSCGSGAWLPGSVRCLPPESQSFSSGGGGVVQSVCPVATVIDICGDSSAESPRTKFACIACLLMLSECSNYGTFCFQGQNLIQTSWRCVIVMIHGSFREPEGGKAGLMRNESRNGNIFRTWSSYSLRIYLVLFRCISSGGCSRSVSYSVFLIPFPLD